MRDILDAVRALVASEGYSGPGRLAPQEHRPQPFVTISRQAGAGGGALAQALKSALNSSSNETLFEGWQIIDAEALSRILQDARLRISLEALAREEYHSPLEEALYQAITNRPPQEAVIHRMFAMTRALAQVGKVIIVGRGGACLTCDLPLGIHLRLVAPLACRVAFMMKLLHTSEKDAVREVAKQDQARVELVKDYFGKDINDPLLFHAVWNTQRTPIARIVPWIMEMIRARAPAPASSLAT